MGALVVVIGGQKSGKSSIASRLARRSGRPVRLVTPARGDDPELAERIARHRADRPADVTVDETFDVAGALRAIPDDAVVVDALDTWLLEAMQERGLFDEDAATAALGSAGLSAQEAVLASVDEIVAASAERDGPTIVIAGTIGMGMHGPTLASRRYEDLHGMATQALGRAAASVLLVVAGRVLELTDVDDLHLELS